jgi:predicted metalloprotease with PDZ domain
MHALVLCALCWAVSNRNISPANSTQAPKKSSAARWAAQQLQSQLFPWYSVKWVRIEEDTPLGLGLGGAPSRTKQKNYLVSRVVQEGQAAPAGIVPGMQLVLVNGEEPGDLTLKQVRLLCFYALSVDTYLHVGKLKIEGPAT